MPPASRELARVRARRGPPGRGRGGRDGTGRTSRRECRRSRGRRTQAHAPSRLPGLRLPLQLGRPDSHEVARPDPLSAELGIDAETGELPLEPLGRLLDVEVRLPRVALDRAPGPPVCPLASDLDAEPVAEALFAVKDDTRRLPWRAKLVGRR